ncbi:uncharacterized protein BDZ99DRAFT_515789 [Mytilinidion resinicola]|uniref:Methyltransferase domain-containing protein n=1 Tax=Mytilinidion resinicola TaxID=574789 RepID=A0A6A6Z203_9PEZI|nr:uncharacterized protein BDZ99DRAFT_515789 [Mytilinidion resinicola]KAF2815030.1 hypothetical protein BDZ99DRAFT_515789 [Mytilinidion resinicola]
MTQVLSRYNNILKMEKIEEVYPLARDDMESRRLNAQHLLTVKACDGHLLDPSIPRHGIRSVADVATDTGIWLTDFANELTTSTSDSTNSPFEFTGFNISTAQFPKEAKPGFAFVAHDMTTPFPAQYLARYDVVHVRLVFSVIVKEQYPAVAENLLALLKPGGYIAWTEYQLDSIHDICPSSILTQFKSIFCKFLESANLSLKPMKEIRAALEANKVENIVEHDYVTFRQPDLAVETQAWLKAAFSALIPTAWVRLGEEKTIEAAAAKWPSYERKMEEAFEEGVVPACPVKSIVARKEGLKALEELSAEEMWQVLADGGWCCAVKRDGELGHRWRART